MSIFVPEVQLGSIQAVRAVHALMESNHQVCISQGHDIKFRVLREKFGADYKIGCDGLPRVKIRIDHRVPRTIVGRIKRPLLFPHSITSYCSGLWKRQRPYRFSFAGIVLDQRKESLVAWMEGSFPDVRVKIPQVQATRLQRQVMRIRRKIGLRCEPRTVKKSFGDVVFWSSSRGRHFPIKSWDDDYFHLLAKSEFVLCPNGAYAWSYRFFEAILCGAIPVVEETCPAYEGFLFYSMEQRADEMAWSLEWAERNYSLAVDRLTVPHERLTAEITHDLARQRG